MPDVSARAAREALAWFTRLNGHDHDAEEMAAFRAWLGADAAHRAEFARLEALWRDLDEIPDPRPAHEEACRPALSRRRWMVGGATAAALAMAGTAGVLDLPTALAADVRTGKGEQRHLSISGLGDVMMDAETALGIDLAGGRRQVTVLKGRARFALSAEAGPTLTLRCAGGRMLCEAGARLTVRDFPGPASLVVQKGHAALSLEAVPCLAPVRVQAGEGADFTADWLGPVRPIDLNSATAWERGWLAFEDEPLWAVVAEMNRYRPGRIVLLGAALSGLKVSGTFDLRHPDRSLQAILATLPVRSHWISRYLVLLREA